MEKYSMIRTHAAHLYLVLGAGEVIEGWDIGIEGMEVGERRQLIVPPELGYGLRGAGNIIPPNATLTFDINLIAIRWPPKLTEIDANMLTKAIATDWSPDRYP